MASRSKSVYQDKPISSDFCQTLLVFNTKSQQRAEEAASAGGADWGALGNTNPRPASHTLSSLLRAVSTSWS